MSDAPGDDSDNVHGSDEDEDANVQYLVALLVNDNNENNTGDRLASMGEALKHITDALS